MKKFLSIIVLAICFVSCEKTSPQLQGTKWSGSGCYLLFDDNYVSLYKTTYPTSPLITSSYSLKKNTLSFDPALLVPYMLNTYYFKAENAQITESSTRIDFTFKEGTTSYSPKDFTLVEDITISFKRVVQ